MSIIWEINVNLIHIYDILFIEYKGSCTTGWRLANVYQYYYWCSCLIICVSAHRSRYFHFTIIQNCHLVATNANDTIIQRTRIRDVLRTLFAVCQLTCRKITQEHLCIQINHVARFHKARECLIPNDFLYYFFRCLDNACVTYWFPFFILRNDSCKYCRAESYYLECITVIQNSNYALIIWFILNQSGTCCRSSGFDCINGQTYR